MKKKDKRLIWNPNKINNFSRINNNINKINKCIRNSNIRWLNLFRNRINQYYSNEILN